MDHATPFYSKQSIQKIPELYKHVVAKLVFHHHHQCLQPLLSNFFSKTNQVSRKSTSLSSIVNNPTLNIRLYKKIRLQKRMRFESVNIWKETPTSIKTKQSFKKFKVSCKKLSIRCFLVRIAKTIMHSIKHCYCNSDGVRHRLHDNDISFINLQQFNW